MVMMIMICVLSYCVCERERERLRLMFTEINVCWVYVIFKAFRRLIDEIFMVYNCGRMAGGGGRC
jgi:hypothetical protein